MSHPTPNPSDTPTPHSPFDPPQSPEEIEAAAAADAADSLAHPENTQAELKALQTGTQQAVEGEGSAR